MPASIYLALVMEGTILTFTLVEYLLQDYRDNRLMMLLLGRNHFVMIDFFASFVIRIVEFLTESSSDLLRRASFTLIVTQQKFDEEVQKAKGDYEDE